LKNPAILNMRLFLGGLLLDMGSPCLSVHEIRLYLLITQRMLWKLGSKD